MDTTGRGCIYQDVFGGWRWEVTDAQGDVRDSNAGCDTREQCLAAATPAGVSNESIRDPEACELEPTAKVQELYESL